MALAEGTVSVLDKDGTVFTRIWCGYEVYVSLVDAKADYKWVVYTALDGVVRAENCRCSLGKV